MGKEELFKKYKMVKTNIQMVEAHLENVQLNKYINSLRGDYSNEISFGIRTEKKDDNKYKGFLKTTVESRNNETEKVELYLEIIYSGLFLAKDEVNSEQMQAWVEAQVVPQLLSYSRSVISHLTSLMAIPPISLPTIDVIKSLEQNDQFTNEE